MHWSTVDGGLSAMPRRTDFIPGASHCRITPAYWLSAPESQYAGVIRQWDAPGMKSVLRGMADRPPSTVDQCIAGVTYLSAPESQYAGVIRQWDAPGMGGRAG